MPIVTSVAGRRAWQRGPLVGLVALLAVVLLAFCVGRDTPGDAGSELPGTSITELPAEVRSTLDLIDRAGPFRYERDGATFGNREGLLPEQPSGYYREYTVPTPEADDRGSRRLVTGQGGEVYYTADHYDSFVRVTYP